MLCIVSVNFLLRLVAFLGHIISSEGIDIDLKKMEAVKNWPRPLTSTEIKSFLSLAKYYRRFFDGFASIASLLKTFTQKKVMFEWSKACERGFQELKANLTSASGVDLTVG